MTGPAEAAEETRAINTGPGRVLVGLYALFALAAGARASVQIATKFSEAPLAFEFAAGADHVCVQIRPPDEGSFLVAAREVARELVG